MHKIPVLVVFGATASGKTEFAYRLFAKSSKSALAGKAEIISADSVQVYKYMNIGSAKPELYVLDEIPHHLIDMKEPSEEFSTSDFVNNADVVTKSIYALNKLPVLLGGTAFFLKNFIFGLPITPKADLSVRAALEKRLVEEGAEVLFAELKNVDPESAKKIHKNDHYRIIRALEVYTATGKPLSSFRLPNMPRDEYSFKLIALYRPRDIIYERINMRVEKMFDEGLYDEFVSLYNKGYRKDSPGMKGIGYSEFFAIAPENPTNASIEAVKDLIKRNTRKYAKRQETFFKAIPNVQMVNLENSDELKQIENEIIEFYNETMLTS